MTVLCKGHQPQLSKLNENRNPTGIYRKLYRIHTEYSTRIFFRQYTKIEHILQFCLVPRKLICNIFELYKCDKNTILHIAEIHCIFFCTTCSQEKNNSSEMRGIIGKNEANIPDGVETILNNPAVIHYASSELMLANDCFRKYVESDMHSSLRRYVRLINLHSQRNLMVPETAKAYQF